LKNTTDNKIRATLKRDFPTTRFHVKRHDGKKAQYFYVRWEDGPAEADVERVIAPLAAEISYRVLCDSADPIR
jgi:hypothetical protein